MVELLALLAANEFANYIVSGGGRDFMRPITQEVYGIPRERVIGSATALAYASDERGGTITRTPAPDNLDDGPEKPIRIWSRIGATAEALSVPDSANVAGTLIAIAEERDARAIVVGSRGLGGIKARMLGSTSRKLLHDTHRPVLVVRTP
jgi:hypothetical protein